MASQRVKVKAGVENGTGRARPLGSLALKWAILAAAAVGTSTLCLSAAVGYRSAKPRRTFGRGSPEEGTFEAVRFPSADGLSISGWFFPAAAPGPGIVICHGFQTGRREGTPLALALRERGYNVLVFDFRAHGESEGRWTSCGVLETLDLEGAVRYLMARPEVRGESVGVVGFSMGAAVAITAAARMREIGAVVADSSFATFRSALQTGFKTIWGLPSFPLGALSLWFGERLVGVCAADNRPVEVVGRLSPRPLLIVHGERDRIVSLREADLLFEAAREPKELWIVPGMDHVQAKEHDLPAYVDRLDDFLTRWLSARYAPFASSASARLQSSR